VLKVKMCKIFMSDSRYCYSAF